MTTPLVFIAICLAGGAGASLRFVLDGVIKARVSHFPVATVVINVTGSFGLGLLTGLGTAAGLPHEWVLILGGGLMGGYTTFSTASVETVRLVQDRRYGAAALYGIGMLVVSIAASGLGLVLGGAF